MLSPISIATPSKQLTMYSSPKRIRFERNSDLRNEKVLKLCACFLKIADDYPLSSVIKERKEYYNIDPRSDKRQQDMIATTKKRIMKAMEEDIMMVCKTDSCFVLKYLPGEKKLTNLQDVNFSVSDHSIIDDAITNLQVQCIHEGTPDRIFMTKKLG